MSKNTANVSINVINKALSVSPPALGIVYVLGETYKGKSNYPGDTITTVSQFISLYGDIVAGNNFPLACQQAIRGGAILRVCRVVGSGALVSTSSPIVDDAATPNPLFHFSSIGEGTYYNGLSVEIKAATNGLSNYFNLEITDSTTEEVEVYENLSVTGFGTAGPYTYLKDIADKSKMVQIAYEDISSLVAQPSVPSGTFSFSGGVDGSSPTIADYIGSSSNKTGFYAFDNYDDGWVLSVPSSNESSLVGLYAAGKAYAESRKDLIYFQHLDNSNISASDIQAELAGFSSSSYVGVFGGGLKVSDTLAGGVKSMQSLGEVLGVVARSQALNGPWISPTSYVNGILPDALGVVNNFGSPASLADLNLIANAGGNMVLTKGGTTMLWDFYSMASPTSQEKFLTIMFLLIYLRRSLKPVLEQFLGKPNTFETWQSLYFTVKPFLDGLVNKEALFEYEWDGDQFASDLSQLQVNNPDDVGNGIYKVQLQIKAIVPIVTLTLDIVLTKTSVSFS